MQPYSPLTLLREWTFNIIVAVYFGYFAYLHYSYYHESASLPTLFFLLYETLIVFLALARRIPKEVSFSLRDWVVAGIGTYAPLMMLSQRAEFPGDSIFLILQLAAIIFSFAGMVSLNRSYGTVPANRGVQTTGLYRIVRHPVYTGYFVSLTCFVIQNLSSGQTTSWNLLILFITLTALVYRIKFEEEFLMRDEAYQQFSQQTRYRLIPKLW